MLKILLGVEYSENGVFGFFVGGLGVDNSYVLDGVDLLLFMFGNLFLELVIYDIVYVFVDCGGVKVIGFNCVGGFSVNLVMKFGINEFYGSLEYCL